ncbi:MAG: hypothetical protein AAF715_09420 [Myxococcota bacterium]
MRTVYRLRVRRMETAGRQARRPKGFRAAVVLAAAATAGGGATACGEPEPLIVDVIVGQETDTFSREPAVTRVELRAVGPGGQTLTAGRAAPGGEVSLGALSDETLVRFDVEGTDVDAVTRVRGRSLSVLIGGVEGGPIPVFAARLARWSRPPGTLAHGHAFGHGGIVGERFVFLTGGEGLEGDAERIAFYDLLGWNGSPGATLPVAAESLAVSVDGRATLLLAGDTATWVVFDDDTRIPMAAPEGLSSFADVSGGRTVVGPDATFIVGATRTRGAPTDRVLVVEADRSLRTARLVRPRAGAAATWVDGVGLVVAGGSEEAPGVEVVAYDPEVRVLEATSRPFAADPTVGATAVAVNGEPWLVCGTNAAGEAAPLRRLDLAGCVEGCAAETQAEAPPTSLVRCDGFTDGPTGMITIGSTVTSASSGASPPLGPAAAFRIDLDAGLWTELPLREPRIGPAVTPTPNGAIALLGGRAPDDGRPVLSVELLFPSAE